MDSEHRIGEGSIWISFQSGDKVSYAHIYDTYYKKLYNYGLRIVPDKNVVEDCIQELFITLWKKKEGLGQPVSIQAYLFKSLRRAIHRAIEKEKRMNQSRLKSHVSESECSHEVHLINTQSQAEQSVKLEQALASLTARQREAIYLKFYSRLAYEEVAGIMELSVESVYNLVSRAVGSLQKKLGDPIHSVVISNYP